MAQINKSEVLSCLFQIRRHRIGAGKRHALHYLFFRHGKKFDVFHCTITKETVELFFDTDNLPDTFFGKRSGQILADNLPAVAYQIVKGHI